MKLNSKNLNKIIKPALNDFFTKEIANILNDVAERNLCSRLAIHFQKYIDEFNLTDYYADAEYNRKQEGQIKTILSERMEVIAITCDLIIHSRGGFPGKDNLIALEMAKINKTDEDLNDDRIRLRALTKTSFDDIWSADDGVTHPEHVCGYVKGLYLIIDHRKRQAILEHYANGAISKEAEVISF